MYSASTDRPQPPPNAGNIVRFGVIGFIALLIVLVVGKPAVALYMNIGEFDDQFTRPLFYSLVSAVILGIIALVRVNIVSRSSIFWYAISTLITFASSAQNQNIQNIQAYRKYKLGRISFVVWQITKILLFGAFFTNILFGFAAMEFIGGDYLGIENIAQLFTLPFVTPPADTTYGTDIVVPMIPALLLLIPPLLGAIGLRLLLYLGVHHILGILTSYIQGESKPNYRKYVSAMEGIVGIGIIWSGFNLFFTSDIDYNTRYTIAGFLLTGSALIVFAAMDRMRSRVLTHMMPKDVLLRIVVIAIIGISVGGIVAVNDGIADAKKIEYLGPYTAQQIGVNRHLAELDKIKLNTHNVDLVSVQPNNIPGYVAENSDVLDVIRVWDWEAAFAKLKPEIGLIPYVDFEDNDILRFNNTLYWTASMKPVLPPSVDIGNRWYNEHLVYTHVPNGFLTLDATKGQIIDSGKSTYGISPISGFSFANAASQSHTRMTSSTSEFSATYPGMLFGCTETKSTLWVFNFILSSSARCLFTPICCAVYGPRYSIFLASAMPSFTATIPPTDIPMIAITTMRNSTSFGIICVSTLERIRSIAANTINADPVRRNPAIVYRVL